MNETTDLTRLEGEVSRLNEELIRVNRLVSVGELSAGIIHEINSPIASIFSNLDVLQKSVDVLEAQVGGAATPKVKHLLEMMRSLLAVDRVACERIAGVIRSLKIHVRTGEEEFRETKLDELLDDSIRLVNAEYRRRVTIVTQYENLQPVECIPQLMGQVFLNLLVNAAQAIEGEGTITVRARIDDGQALIEIADTGIGMSEECRKKVFVEGFTTKPPGVGTGLGLAITYKIVVERHQGSLNCDSVPGKGTTFYIRIPLRRAAAKES